MDAAPLKKKKKNGGATVLTNKKTNRSCCGGGADIQPLKQRQLLCRHLRAATKASDFSNVAIVVVSVRAPHALGGKKRKKKRP